MQLFGNPGTSDIANGQDTKAARKTCAQVLWRKASMKLKVVVTALELHELNIPPGNKLEKLVGDREGQYSIRINNQYRICFAWTDAGARNIEIVDYH
ncbi:MAG: type II toxin-antitoxin system RelE/ParE family toxin [Cyanobacteria bacterium J06642_2]